MSEITEITPQKKDKKRCSIYLDGKFYCGLTLETTVKYRLKVGQDIDIARLEEIQLESEKMTALDKALTYISVAQKPKNKIIEYLEKKGYLSPVINFVIDKMEDYGYIDDEMYAKSYAESAVKRKGSRLIKMELKQKGINDEFINNAIDDLNQETEEDTAFRIIEKYMKNKIADKQTLYKAFRYLISKGFDYDIARNALSRFGELSED